MVAILLDHEQEIIKVRERILGIGLIPKVIPLKLFLDTVPSSSEDVTPTMRGQPTRLSQNNQRGNGGKFGENVILYVLIFKRRFIADMLSTLSAVVLFAWAFV